MVRLMWRLVWETIKLCGYSISLMFATPTKIMKFQSPTSQKRVRAFAWAGKCFRLPWNLRVKKCFMFIGYTIASFSVTHSGKSFAEISHENLFKVLSSQKLAIKQIFALPTSWNLLENYSYNLLKPAVIDTAWGVCLTVRWFR